MPYPRRGGEKRREPPGGARRSRSARWRHSLRLVAPDRLRRSQLGGRGRRQRDIVAVIKGVIAAESGAIEHYSTVVVATEERDPVTNDLVIDILHDEQRHRRRFEGFLRGYTSPS